MPRCMENPIPGISFLSFRKAFIPFFFLGLIFFCASGVRAEPRYGGRLVIGTESDSLGFDALKARNLWGAGMVSGNMIMERLFELGPDRELIPVLGLSAEPSPDGKTWTVKLREGIKFHDQTPFNADAVVKHWERLLDPKSGYQGRFVLTPIKSVEKTGEYEVRFNLNHAWLPFIDTLTDERGFTALIPSPKAVEDGSQNRAPVGTGPFVFKEWKTGDRIVVVKNPEYWKKDRPYLDEVVFRVIPDLDTKFTALVTGQVDLIVSDRPQHVKKVQNDPDYQSLRWNAGLGYFALNTVKPPLSDVRVRQALAYAWDQDKYVKASFKGIYEPAHDIFGGTLDCPDVGYKAHDLAKSKALLTEYGHPVTVQYLHSSTLRGKEAGAIAEQIFKQAGVTLEPVPLAFSGIMKRILEKDYDMASWILARASDMGPTLYATLHSKGPWNVTKFSNKEVDELLDEQRMSQDPEKRKEIFCRIARIVNEEVPLIFIFKRDYYLLFKNKVKGIPQPAYIFLRLSDAWLEP